jgi:hypothetical protein
MRRSQFTSDEAILYAPGLSSPKERSRREVLPVDEGQPESELQLPDRECLLARLHLAGVGCAD